MVVTAEIGSGEAGQGCRNKVTRDDQIMEKLSYGIIV